MESALKNVPPDTNLQPLLTPLELPLQAGLSTLGQWAEQLHPLESSTMPPPCHISHERLQELLLALRDPLAKRQLRARKLHETLQQETAGLEIEELAALTTAVERLDFKTALELVEQLLSLPKR